MEFTVTIRLGNAEMRTGPDISEALQSVCAQLEDIEEPYLTSRRIKDANGARVGSWGFTEE